MNAFQRYWWAFIQVQWINLNIMVCFIPFKLTGISAFVTYLHSMICRTEGIHPSQPPKWRSLDGAVGVYWKASGEAGAHAYYLSPDPRIVIFFNDVSRQIGVTNDNKGERSIYRPMTQAIYVPAGVPLWTNFRTSHRFSHLDLHIHKDKLLKILAPSLGRSAAQAAAARPVELQDARKTGLLATLLVDELADTNRYALHAENLMASVVTSLVDVPPKTASTGAVFTQAQMKALSDLVTVNADRRVSVGDMSACIGLPESSFASAFRKQTGLTPLQWQIEQRIALSKNLMRVSDLSIAQIAAQTGFTDQAHFTKTFRKVTGETPALWRSLTRFDAA